MSQGVIGCELSGLLRGLGITARTARACAMQSAQLARM